MPYIRLVPFEVGKFSSAHMKVFIQDARVTGYKENEIRFIRKGNWMGWISDSCIDGYLNWTETDRFIEENNYEEIKCQKFA